MTTPHDPLAVVAELAKALKGWTDYFDSLQRDAALVDPCDPLIAVRAQMHGKRMNDSLAALTRAAAMPEPAPEHQPYPHVGDNDSWTGPTAAMPAGETGPSVEASLLAAMHRIINQEQHDGNAETHMHDMADIAREAFRSALAGKGRGE